jgi:hypothetical protein
MEIIRYAIDAVMGLAPEQMILKVTGRKLRVRFWRS